MEKVQEKHHLFSKKKFLRDSHFFLYEDLTSKQQEERREEVEKNRVPRNEGKRACLDNGKEIVAMFTTQKKQGNKQAIKKKQRIQ